MSLFKSQTQSLNQSLNQRRILITGGTSGLGRALALEFASRGARVAAVARGQNGLDNLRQIAPGIIGIRGDISDKHEIHRIHAEAASILGDIDILINNASSLGPTSLKLLLDTECEEFEDALQTNVLGPFRLTKLILPAMILNRFGIVVNISSDAAINAYPTWGAYGTSKAAIDHLTRVFQVELADTGINFLAIDPGDMDTPLHLAAVPDADRSQLYQPRDSARLLIEQLESKQFTPIRRGLR